MKRKLCTAAVCIGMLLALALPAWAAEYGEANITPQTTMNELRENPSIVGSGLYTYSREQDCTLKQAYWGTQELEKFSNQWTAQDAAEGLNQLIRNYRSPTRCIRQRKLRRTPAGTLWNYTIFRRREKRKTGNMHWCWVEMP